MIAGRDDPEDAPSVRPFRVFEHAAPAAHAVERVLETAAVVPEPAPPRALGPPLQYRP
jgi:hypothetical protein